MTEITLQSLSLDIKELQNTFINAIERVEKIEKIKEYPEVRNLKAHEIEIRVGRISEKGCSLLLYKTSRTDMQILDDTYGRLNWKNDYKVVNNNLYCGIAIRDLKTNEFMYKWNCGIESKQNDGNEAKAEASDAFKRAGVQWGIGRELYTAPNLWANVLIKEVEFGGKKKYDLVDRYAKFYVKEIEYVDNSISRVIIVDNKGKEIINFNSGRVENKPTINPAPTPAPAPTIELATKEQEQILDDLMADKVAICNYLKVDSILDAPRDKIAGVIISARERRDEAKND